MTKLPEITASLLGRSVDNDLLAQAVTVVLALEARPDGLPEAAMPLAVGLPHDRWADVLEALDEFISRDGGILRLNGATGPSLAILAPPSPVAQLEEEESRDPFEALERLLIRRRVRDEHRASALSVIRGLHRDYQHGVAQEQAPHAFGLKRSEWFAPREAISFLIEIRDRCLHLRDDVRTWIDDRLAEEKLQALPVEAPVAAVAGGSSLAAPSARKTPKRTGQLSFLPDLPSRPSPKKELEQRALEDLAKAFEGHKDPATAARLCLNKFLKDGHRIDQIVGAAAAAAVKVPDNVYAFVGAKLKSGKSGSSFPKKSITEWSAAGSGMERYF